MDPIGVHGAQQSKAKNAVEDKLKTMQLSMYRDRQSGTLSAVTTES